MYRKHLEPDRGMLFLMPREEIQSFWMRNTYIPLDMIFIDSELRVVNVAADTTPLTDGNYRSIRPAHYVVEVNAGWAAEHGVTEGTRVEFDNVRLANAK